MIMMMEVDVINPWMKLNFLFSDSFSNRKITTNPFRCLSRKSLKKLKEKKLLINTSRSF